MRIEVELHSWYVAHPENNWSQDNYKIIDIKIELARDDWVQLKEDAAVEGLLRTRAIVGASKAGVGPGAMDFPVGELTAAQEFPARFNNQLCFGN